MSSAFFQGQAGLLFLPVTMESYNPPDARQLAALCGTGKYRLIKMVNPSISLAI